MLVLTVSLLQCANIPPTKWVCLLWSLSTGLCKAEFLRLPSGSLSFAALGAGGLGAHPCCALMESSFNSNLRYICRHSCHLSQLGLVLWEWYKENMAIKQDFGRSLWVRNHHRLSILVQAWTWLMWFILVLVSHCHPTLTTWIHLPSLI